jgi:hypothetical protein
MQQRKELEMVAKKNSNNKRKVVKHGTKAVSVKPEEFLSQCVNHIARKIVDSKTADGRTPHGVAEKLLQEGKNIFPSMTMNMINYAVKKLINEEGKPKLKKSTVTFSQQTCVSSLTGGSTSIKKSACNINTDRDYDAAGTLLALNSSNSGTSSDNECDSTTTASVETSISKQCTSESQTTKSVSLFF